MKYLGQMEDGKREGKGLLQYFDSQAKLMWEYAGSFKDDQLQGFGRIKYAQTGTIFVGNFNQTLR